MHLKILEACLRVIFGQKFSKLNRLLGDYFILGWYDVNYYNALQMLCIAPMATNAIVLASLYKIHPDKMATAVLLSLIFVLVYIPVMATIFLQDIAPIT